mgnify:FL=1
MSRTRSPYPAAFREQIVALLRAGCSIDDLAEEFEPCAANIHSWEQQAERDARRHADVLSRAAQSRRNYGVHGEKTASSGRSAICSHPAVITE